METLHLRADSNTLEAVMSIINQFAQSGQTIKVLDNVTYNREQAMIFQGLAEERQGQLINHKDLWADLLET